VKPRKTRPGPPPEAPPPAWARPDGLWLLAIVGLALLLRLIYVFQYQANPFFDHPIMDSRNHDLWARSYLSGEPFLPGHPYFRAPLYPWFLAACYRLFGDGYLAPRLAQALLGALSCGLVFLIARCFHGRWASAGAGLAAAGCWLMIHFDAELLDVPLGLFLNLLGLYLFTRAWQGGALRFHAAAGLALGLAAIARPTVLLFAALAAAALWLANRREPRAALRRAGILVAACLVPILPITIRNALVGGDFVPIASQGGLNLYIGNHPGADGTTAELPGGMADWRGSYFESIAMAEQALGRKLRPSEVSAHFTRESLRFAAGSPGEWLALMGRKFRLFWNRAELADNQPIRFFAERYAPIARWLPVGFGLLAPLGALGLLLALRDPRRFFPLWGYTAASAAAVIAFFVTTRFKMPAVPGLILLAAGAVEWGAGALRARRRGPLLAAALALAALAAWTHSRPAGVDPQEAHAYEILGMREMERGDAAAGIEHFRAGLRAGPRFAAGLHIRLGHALLARGDLAGAEREFAAGLQCEARHPREFAMGTLGLGLIAEQRGDLSAALAHYGETLRLDPEQAEARARWRRLRGEGGR